MVYRPPKHKPAPGERSFRPSTDPLSGATSRADDPDQILKGDDRNLVTVDENYSSGDLEDRLWLFWQRHNSKVVRALVALCLLLVGWQGWSLYQAHQLGNEQAAYNTATQSPETLLAFSQANADSTLGKIALLEAADSYYKAGKFKDAVDAYSKAAAAWGGDEKGQRAQLGWALSLVSTGDAAGAHQHLENLYNSAANIENFRAEAAFDNAVIYAKNADKDNATVWIDRAESMTNSPAWASQAKTFREMLPLLSDVKLVSGNYQAAPAVNKAPTTGVPGVSALPIAAPPAASAASAPAATAKPAATTAPASTGGFDLSKLKN